MDLHGLLWCPTSQWLADREDEAAVSDSRGGHTCHPYNIQLTTLVILPSMGQNAKAQMREVTLANTVSWVAVPGLPNPKQEN